MAGLVFACPVSEAGGPPGRASGQASGRTLGQTTGKQEPEKYVPGALYVKFADHAVSYVKSAERECPVSSLFPAKSARSRYGLKPVAYSMHLFRASTLDNVFRIEFDSVRKTAEFIEALRNDPRVVFVEQVPLQTIQVEPAGQDGKNPGDYFFGNIDSIHTSWNLEMVGYSEIYGRYQGKSEVKAAVVDNAVWGDHEDLQLLYDNLYDTFLGVAGSASPPSGVNQQAQGSAQMPSDAYGWSHGTHCAGVVGALTGNGTGIASVAGGITVMGVKTAETSSREMTRTLQGVVWAVENGAKVVSMSYGSDTYSSVEEEVYSSLARQGVVLVAAAGNDGKKDAPNYPAAYPGVISVGSLDSDGSRSSFSNYGDWVDVWAPGGSYVENGQLQERELIFSSTFCITQYLSDKEAFAGRYYDMMAGTSMATPLVASASALLLSYYPGLNGYSVQEILQASSKETGIYLPEAFAVAESAPGRMVRGLRADWNPATGICYLSWESPEEEGVLSYTFFRNGQAIEAGLTETRFQHALDDTAGFVGIRAVYEEGVSLTAYVPVSASATAGSEPSLRPARQEEGLQVRVDRAGGLLYVEGGEAFDRIAVFNLQGVQVAEFPGGSGPVDIGGLLPGLYVGRASKAGAVRAFKFAR